ncbi:hypothetical protein B0H17DRAFT_1149421 [Mycena rosella]|uniref:Uncharacterized protein n=1 Tax=Mycena rosella TaxID=1033263 RepID=A0AAD7C2W7_MYCRO|nr:hypothetical protein B0H17DRAFT_1149421 [Mycena rosella]
MRLARGLQKQAPTLPSPASGIDQRCRRCRRLPVAGMAISRMDSFRDLFNIEKRHPKPDKADENGEPKGYIVHHHWLSTEWLQKTQTDFLGSLSDLKQYTPDSLKTSIDTPFRYTIKAQYVADIAQRLLVASDSESLVEQANAVRKDAARLGSPALETNWAPVLRALFDLAEKRHAPWRCPVHTAGRSSTTDTVSPVISTLIEGSTSNASLTGTVTYADAKKHCIATTKNASSTRYAEFPVAIDQFKADVKDLPHAEGEALYSAVQAAGIFRNCLSKQKLLTVAIAHGFARPCASGWTGPGSADSIQLDAFSLCKDAMAAQLTLQAMMKYRVAVNPGPLVDWRARTLPPSLLRRQKRRAGKQPGRPTTKRVKLTSIEAEGDAEAGAETETEAEVEAGAEAETETETEAEAEAEAEAGYYTDSMEDRN